ncbi:hypothetical protein E2562_019890 [Oryza meyeriana var. granulata]|uniref:Uncharacterized protein n=1 Tax=Oryza meyeriana var. granulata TaxID=110450 RepID=A0A6G1EXE4_9ORYZ|nr:hypothetical protein E2562_019890 [Oryza meyeriana var. granulata]
MAMAVDRRAGAIGKDGSREEKFLYRKTAAAPASTSSSLPPSSSPFAAAVQGGLVLQPVPPSSRNMARNGGVAWRAATQPLVKPPVRLLLVRPPLLARPPAPLLP